jgi:hypothetical protein
MNKEFFDQAISFKSDPNKVNPYVDDFITPVDKTIKEIEIKEEINHIKKKKTEEKSREDFLREMQYGTDKNTRKELEDLEKRFKLLVEENKELKKQLGDKKKLEEIKPETSGVATTEAKDVEEDEIYNLQKLKQSLAVTENKNLHKIQDWETNYLINDEDIEAMENLKKAMKKERELYRDTYC